MPAPDRIDQSLALNLVWSPDTGAGLRRRRKGRGFSYRDALGHPARDPETLARIRALAAVEPIRLRRLHREEQRLLALLETLPD